MKKSFDIVTYQKARIPDLILFGINSIVEEDKSSSTPKRASVKLKKENEVLFASASARVIENKEKCTFERLIKECFTLFPRTFCFSKYPQWPDARKLDRPLRLLRKRKLITGDPKTYFSLTKLGKKIALEAAKTFRQRKLFK